MFMPPASDDQTRSQQKMMKYMVVFIGYLYYTVPSGLCLYIIVSSAWGIAERKLLPKSQPKTAGLATASASRAQPAATAPPPAAIAKNSAAAAKSTAPIDSRLI